MKTKRSIADLLGKIDFSPNNIVAAAAVNTVLFVEALDFRRESLEAKTRTKMALSRTEAEFDVEARRTAKALGEKITERQIESMMLLDDVIQARQDASAKAEEYDEYVKLVVEAFRMRRDCLEIVASLVRNEISSQDAYEAGSEKLVEQRKALRKKFPGAI
jgi:hypothetical protein